MKLWWLRLAGYARTRWRGVALLVALSLVAVGVDVLKPWPMKIIVDDVLAGQATRPPRPWLLNWLLPAHASPVTLLAILTVATVLLFIAGWMMQMIQAYLQVGVGNRMVYDLGERLFDHLQRQALRFHGRHRAGDLVRRIMTDSGCIRTLVLWAFLPMLSSVVSVVAMVVILWRMDRTLTLISLAVAPLLLVLIKLFAGPMSRRSYEQQQLDGEMSALGEQTLTSLAIVQAFGREEHEDRRFRELSRRAVQAYMRTTVTGLEFKVSTSVITALGTATIVLLGGRAVLLHNADPTQGITLGSLLVFLAYLAAMYAPMETLAYATTQFAAAAAGAQRVLEILDVREAVVEKPHALPVSGGAGHVQVENITFGYEEGRPVLENVSFQARPGEVVALVGPTGSGKSTLVSLVPRFFDPWQGRVLLGEVDVKDLQIASLRSQVSLVLQEPFLLPLSIAQNIAYGKPGAGLDQIIAAAKAANAEEFILKLPQGYDTIIGERGATLSGGQRQRLAIARAILKNAPILILDEPTSALDAHTEQLILDALEKLMAKRTTLVIAHRLSTVRKADRIVVLEHGRIVESGSHAALLARGGLYHSLYQLQFRDSDEKDLQTTGL